MFGSNNFGIIDQMVRLHQQELLHEAEEQRLAAAAARGAGSVELPFFQRSAWRLGTALIALGERLAPDSAALQPAGRLTYSHRA